MQLIKLSFLTIILKNTMPHREIGTFLQKKVEVWEQPKKSYACIEVVLRTRKLGAFKRNIMNGFISIMGIIKTFKLHKVSY